MSGPFDPYYTWLGIRPGDQPPNHYRLLGLERFEDNADVIANAADQRMAHLRSFKSPEHLPHSQRLLNEISQARVVLLNSAQKATYDAKLHKQLEAARTPTLPMATPLAEPQPKVVVLTPAAQVVEKHSADAGLLFGFPKQLVLIGGIAAALVVVVAIGVIASMGGGETPESVVAQTGVEKKPATNETEKQPVEDPSTVAGTAVESEESAPEETEAKPVSAEEVAQQPANSTLPESTEPTSVEPAADSAGSQPENESAKPAEATPVTASETREPAAEESPSSEPPKDASATPDEESISDEASTQEIGESSPSSADTENDNPKSESVALLAVPDKAAQATALKTVEEVLGDEMKGANTPDKKHQLAITLLRHAGDSKGEPINQYVLLNKAYEAAIGTGEAALIENAVTSMAETFEIDPLRLKASGYFTASNQAKTPQLQKELVQQSFQLMDDAVAAERFDIALPMEKVLAICNRKLRDGELTKESRERMAAIKLKAKEFEKLAPAKAAFAKNPNDPAANLTLGKYSALSQGHWDEALAHFVKCDDTALVDLAKRDLAEQGDAEAKAKMGDAWFDYAAANKEQEGFYARADYWYRAAAPTLTGLVRKKIDQRLQITAKHVVGADAEQVVMTPAVSKVILESKEPQVALVWAIRLEDSDTHRYTFVLFANGSVGSPESPFKWNLDGNTLTIDPNGEPTIFTLDATGTTGKGRWLRGGHFDGFTVWANTSPKNPKVVNVWDLKIEDNPNPIPLVLFANGRLTDPNGKLTWSATTSEMIVNLPDGVCVLVFQPDGTARGDWKGKSAVAQSAITQP